MLSVITDQTKERILHLLQKYVANNYGSDEDDESESIRTRIFSD